MKRIITKLLLKLLKIPQIYMGNDKEKEMEFFSNMYSNKEFRNYIARRDLEILQLLGGGVSREDYLAYLGQRVELGMLLQFAKKNWEKEQKVKNRLK